MILYFTIVEEVGGVEYGAIRVLSWLIPLVSCYLVVLEDDQDVELLRR
jgi:hypothetical protein